MSLVINMMNSEECSLCMFHFVGYFAKFFHIAIPFFVQAHVVVTVL